MCIRDSPNSLSNSHNSPQRLGKYVEGSGIDQAWVEAGLYSPTTVTQILTCIGHWKLIQLLYSISTASTSKSFWNYSPMKKPSWKKPPLVWEKHIRKTSIWTQKADITSAMLLQKQWKCLNPGICSKKSNNSKALQTRFSVLTAAAWSSLRTSSSLFEQLQITRHIATYAESGSTCKVLLCQRPFKLCTPTDKWVYTNTPCDFFVCSFIK